MTFQLRHEWSTGASVNGARLSCCMHCETLRVSIEAPPGEYFIRRKAEERERVKQQEPPCIAPAPFFKPPW